MTRWLKGIINLLCICLLGLQVPFIVQAATGETETPPAVAPAPIGFSQLQRCESFQGALYGTFICDYSAGDDTATVTMTSFFITAKQSSTPIPISWNGTSFSGKYLDAEHNTSVSGTVSSDGNNLISLTYTRESLLKGSAGNIQESLRIVLGGQFPIWGTVDMPWNTVTSSGVAQYVSSLSFSQTMTQDGSTLVFRSADSYSGLNIRFNLPLEEATPVTSTTAKPATTTVATTAASAYEPKFSGINGQVEILLPGAKEWDFADLNSDLPPGTHIRTGIDSTCVLSFGDMSTFILKPEAEVIVADKPDAKSIKTFKGDVWANFKKMVIDGTMDVEMQQAVAGIKGTTFICEERQGASTVKVIEGTVQLTDKLYGAHVILEDGEFATASMTTGIGDIKDFDAAGEAALWDNIRTEAESVSKESSPLSGILSSIPLIPVAIGAGIFILLLIVIGIARRKK